MHPDDLNPLIRMAQVLRVRIDLMANELSTTHGPQTASLRKAAEETRQVELRLVRVFNDLMTDNR